MRASCGISQWRYDGTIRLAIRFTSTGGHPHVQGRRRNLVEIKQTATNQDGELSVRATGIVRLPSRLGVHNLSLS